MPPTHRNRFFVYIAIAMLVVIALGFGRSFYLRPLYYDTALPDYLVMHGVAMTAWYLLFLVQATLVNVHRTDLHRKFGIAGMVVAAAVVVTAVYVDLNLVPRRIALGGEHATPEGVAANARFAIGSLSSVVTFALIVTVAVALRRNLATHKRLMFWAYVWSLGPAFTNTRPLGEFLDPLVAPYLPFFPADLIWLALLLAYDWKTLRRIHPATWLGFLSLVVLFFVGEFWVADLEVLQNALIAFSQR